jgi:hypothetical protein
MAAVREKLHKMRVQNVCMVAALRTVLHLQYDVHIAENVLEAFGTEAHSPIRVDGTCVTKFRRMVREANRAFNTEKPWKVLIRRRAGWDLLFEATAQGRRPIARVRDTLQNFRNDPAVTELHAVVVFEVDGAGDEIKIFDPSSGKLHRLRWEEFLEWWTDTDGTRWMATLSP